MKKSLCVSLIVILLVSVIAVGCIVGNGQLAYAADANTYLDIDVDGVTYRLFTKTANNTPVGVYLYEDRLFGASEIPVTVEIYSTPDTVIDFSIGSTALTTAQLAVRNKLVDLFSDAIRLFSKINALASTALNTSEVVAYNNASKGTRLQITCETYEMLLLAQQMYEITGGAFNPAVYRLVDLWGFSSRIYSKGNFGLDYDREVTAQEFWRDGYPLPETKYIDAFSDPEFTDFSKSAVVLEELDGQYFVTKNVAAAVVDNKAYEQWIDLGGIAKGYAVDKARELIAGWGIDRFFVDAGSSSKAFGWEYDGGLNTMGIQDASSFFSVLLSVDIGKTSVSTSGQYVRKYTVDGVEYAHILDGVTGAPAQTGIKAVTVIAPQGDNEYWAAKGDCLTTALTVMGRDKIVDFVNGYLKDNNIKIVVQYETLKGAKQIISNYSKDEVTLSDSGKGYAWALNLGDDGLFYYDANAEFNNPTNTYNVILIVLGCILGAGAVALVVYHFVRGRKTTSQNVQNAKKDKPFKVLDVMVYICVVLVILVLFYVFIFDTDNTQLQVVNVVDIETGETLFIYNVTRNEYMINSDSINHWDIAVSDIQDGIEITFTREIQGEQRKNIVHVSRGRNPSVVMHDSVCGRSKDCVRNFTAVSRSGGTIVCSPNRLKITT
ncbi:MAG: FAD:protein FMN transferase [Clostridiales bacterium]|nr:FAD:protein FMN transferase [Clostridiales bacterium]